MPRLAVSGLALRIEAKHVTDCRDLAFKLIVGHFFHRLELVLNGQGETVLGGWKAALLPDACSL
jgi:hypothetical protein